MNSHREIFVYMDNEQNREPRFIGVLYRELLRGKEIFFLNIIVSGLNLNMQDCSILI